VAAGAEINVCRSVMHFFRVTVPGCDVFSILLAMMCAGPAHSRIDLQPQKTAAVFP